MKKTLVMLFLSCLSLLFTACGSNDTPDDPIIPDVPVVKVSLTQPTTSDITETSVTVSTTVDGDDSSMTRHGFCYATTHNPGTDGTTVELTSGWTTSLTGLEPATYYYVRAFLTNSSGTIYSPEASFTTAEAAPVDPLATYEAPAYPDDYRLMADWNQRNKWNLANVHDPTVMKADDGYFYMYQTDASFGNAHLHGGHFHARRSRDLVNWEYMGGTMSNAPTWVKDSLNSVRRRYALSDITNPQYGYWAPCARKVKSGLYRMYYVIVVDNYIQSGLPTTQNFDGSWTERAFIGLMETADPSSNKWEDKGYVVCSSSDRGTNWKRSSTNDWSGYFRFNAIDPSYIITPEGEHWLIYGSWHSGLAALQLDAETGKPLNQLGTPFATADDPLRANYGKQVYTRKMNDRWQASEAPEVVWHDGYYYLFLAYDALDIPYNTRVVRSKHIDGPYVGINGTNVTQQGGEAYPVMTHPYKFAGHHGWVGISHCAIFDDGNGHWFYASQGRFPTNYDTWAPNAIMMGHVRSIRWTKSGWPLVMPERYGGVPQVAVKEEELAGSWDIINLSYKYGEQKSSTSMELGQDHKVTLGTWQGKDWTFDATNQLLTIGDVELYVQRECDWEATPRHATIVFAGLNGSGTVTYWGKRN